MTEYTPEQVADLIAVAQTWNPTECAASPVGAWHTIERLADALEAVSAERDAAIREMHARELHHFEEEQARAKAEAERDEALTVIAEVNSAVGPNVIYAPDDDEDWGSEQDAYMEGAEHVLGTLRRILSRIPEHPKED